MAEIHTLGATGVPASLRHAVFDTADRIDHIKDVLCAHRAVEQFVTPWQIDVREDSLGMVDRSNLGWLLTVLNNALEVAIEAAADHIEAVNELARGQEEGT